MKAWNSEQIFCAGDPYFASLKEAIAQAQASIDLESYIFDSDHIGKEITLALQAAAQRGVLVRLLVDGFGAIYYDRRTYVKTLDPCFQVRVFRPMLLRFFRFKRSNKSLFFRFFRWIRFSNHRNHRKVSIFDSKIAFVGSINISEVHSERFKKSAAWRDTSIRVEGEEVAFLTEAFERSWRKSIRHDGRIRWKRTGVFRRPTQTEGSTHLVRLNDTLHLRRTHYQDLLQRIITTKNRVWMTSAYFAPHFSLLRALRLAAWKGRDVRVLIPQKTDIWIFRWVTPAFYYFLLEAGVKIYEYVPRMLHAKTLLIDDWALIGSSNMNHRTLLHDLEVDVVVSKNHSKKALESQFSADLFDSSEVTLTTLRGRSRLGRWIGKISLLLIRRWL